MILPRHKILMLEGEVQSLTEVNSVLRAENERLQSAICWALGEASDDNGKSFGEVRPPLEARYWWRTTLRRMAGMGDLKYDKERRTIVKAGHG